MRKEAEYYRDLGQRIQRERKNRGLSQEGLASMVGLTRTSIVNIEKGRQKVLAHTLVRLARSLKMKIEVLARDSSEAVEIDDLLSNLSESQRQFVRSAITPGQKDK